MERMEAKKGIRKFGIRFGLAISLFVILQLVAGVVLSPILVQTSLETRVLASFGLTIFVVDIVIFPTAYFICKGLPKGELEHEKWGFWKYVLGILMVAGICMTGMLIGLPVHLLLTLPFGVDLSDSSTIGILMMNSSFFPRVITVAILAPIFEELIFRKVLIDHLSYYSKYLAVLVSGIAFGLFHGNFQQFFFAMGLGWFFAYVYVKTGNIKYTIGYHMIVNMTTSVVTMAFTKSYMEAYERIDMDALARGVIRPDMIADLIPMLLYMGYMFLLFAIGVAGIILVIVNFKKFKLQPVENELSKAEAKKEAFTNIGLWVIYAVCLYLFGSTYLPAMLHPMKNTSVATDWEQSITVENGDILADTHSIPLEVTQAGSGMLRVKIESEDNNVHFITGVVLRTPSGEVDRAFYAGTMTGDYTENSLEQGTYQAELYFLANEEDFQTFCSTYLPEEDDLEWYGPNNGPYQDGDYAMKYHVEMQYKVQK